MKNIKLFSEKGIRLEKKTVDTLVLKLQAELEFEIESL